MPSGCTCKKRRCKQCRKCTHAACPRGACERCQCKRKKCRACKRCTSKACQYGCKCIIQQWRTDSTLPAPPPNSSRPSRPSRVSVVVGVLPQPAPAVPAVPAAPAVLPSTSGPYKQFLSWLVPVLPKVALRGTCSKHGGATEDGGHDDGGAGGDEDNKGVDGSPQPTSSRNAWARMLKDLSGVRRRPPCDQLFDVACRRATMLLHRGPVGRCGGHAWSADGRDGSPCINGMITTMTNRRSEQQHQLRPPQPHLRHHLQCQWEHPYPHRQTT